MIIVVQPFSFKADTTDDEKATVLTAMRRTSTVESVSFSAVGQYLGDPADGYTHAYFVAIEDLAALERYFYDPVHLDGDWEILPRLARLGHVRLSDDTDPELRDKITAMFLKKVSIYPDWGRLLETIPGRPQLELGVGDPGAVETRGHSARQGHGGRRRAGDVGRVEHQ